MQSYSNNHKYKNNGIHVNQLCLLWSFENGAVVLRLRELFFINLLKSCILNDIRMVFEIDFVTNLICHFKDTSSFDTFIIWIDEDKVPVLHELIIRLLKALFHRLRWKVWKEIWKERRGHLQKSDLMTKRIKEVVSGTFDDLGLLRLREGIETSFESVGSKVQHTFHAVVFLRVTTYHHSFFQFS